MIIYLRTQSNNNIADVEIYINEGYVDLRSSIYIKEYSKMLLNLDKSTQLNFIRDFEDIDELRGWLWEVYFMVKNNTPNEKDNVIDEVRKIIKEISLRYNLMVVED